MQRFLRHLAWPFKIAYALSAGVLCVLWLSFVPGDGPPLTLFIPSSAASLLHIPDGLRLLKAAQHNAALREMLEDEDLKALQPEALRLLCALNDTSTVDGLLNDPTLDLQQLKKRYAEALKRNPRALAWLLWLFPPTPEGLEPLLGQDLAWVSLNPDQSAERRQPELLFVRLSGVRGALIRIGAYLGKRSRDTRVFDLGGGLMAIGLNGATLAQPTGKNLPLPFEITASVGTLARLAIFSPQTLTDAEDQAAVEKILASPQFRELAQTVPKSVSAALASPPSATEIFNLPATPREIQLQLLADDAGQLSLQGKILGALPPLPKAVAAARSSEAIAEARLPLDVRQLFLWYIAAEMRIKPAAEELRRPQRAWRARFTQFRLSGIDLDRDFWPAFGQVVSLNVGEPAGAISASPLGVIRLEVPFRGERPDAFEAAAHFSYQWGRIYDRPQEDQTQTVQHDDYVGFVRPWLKLNTCAWLFSAERFALTSDAGVLARSKPQQAMASLLRQTVELERQPDTYFVRFDGQRLAKTVEILAQTYYDKIEEDLGPLEFSERYSDVRQRVRRAGKLSRLLGHFSLELKPTQSNSAQLKACWKPGTLKGYETDESSGEPTPPPPLDDDEDVAAPPAL